MQGSTKFEVADWEAFLRAWDREALELSRKIPEPLVDRVSREVLDRGTILRAPASATDLQRAGEKFGKALPVSVSRFYRTSNGLSVL